MDLKKKNDETTLQYIWRLASAKDAGLLDITWDDLAEIFNNNLGQNYNSCTYRKPYNQAKAYYDEVFSKMDSKTYASKIQEHTHQLIKERNKLQTEKLEYNRWLREEARDELFEEKVLTAIHSLDTLEIPNRLNVSHDSKEYILTIADLHYGKEVSISGLFGETINEYSPEICEERLWKLRDEIVALIQKENIQCLRIYNLSDNIEGVLRMSQLMKLRYGIVDSTIKVSDLLSNWLNDLSKYTHIVYAMCMDGNHDEIRSLIGKKGTFVDDNMNKIVFKFIQERLKYNPNVEILEQNTEMIFDQVCGFNILACHGDTKNITKSLREFSSIYGVDIQYLFGGHMHHSSQEDTGVNSEVILVPSIIGIDDYSMKLRKTSNPAAKLFVFEDGLGKTIEYTIKL